MFLIMCFILLFSVSSCEILDDDYIFSPFSQHLNSPKEYDDSGATRILNVASVSLILDPVPDVNRNKIIAFIEKIVSEQPAVRLILFGETSLGYYYRPSNPSEYQNSIAETIPGITTGLISQKAIEHQVYISFGMVERSGDNIYNSQILINPDGEIESVYRKQYLNREDKESGFSTGNSISIDIVDNIKVATIICYDSASKRVNGQIQASGAELVLFPAAVNTGIPAFFYPLRPRHIKTWLLLANRAGNEDGIEYTGSIYLSTPTGINRVEMTGREGYIFAQVRCR
ncbi:MAG: carbon-nitrogen hydrolase family protein [Treponema sp.]|nr:carbon-nitrogen hydrolase family protein [Treponema sp.]